MKSVFNLMLVFSILALASCDSSNKNIVNDLNKNIENPQKTKAFNDLEKITIIDTIQNITEYYWVDTLGWRQGLSYSHKIENPSDTFIKLYYFNDTLLNYINSYSGNKITKIAIPDEFNLHKGSYIQEWRHFDSTGNLISSESCYIDWNYDISRVINTEKDTITIKGEHACHGKEFFESIAAAYFNGEYLDTTYLQDGKVPDFTFELKDGLNRIKIYHSSSSYMETYDDTIWLDKEYIIFVNKEKTIKPANPTKIP